MRTFKSLMISLCMGTTLCMCLPQTTTAQTVSSGDSWTWDKGTIVIDTPERPAGQKSVLEMCIRDSFRHELYRSRKNLLD